MPRKNKGHKKLATPRFVTVFDLALNDGGPEEGGWWYTSGYGLKTIKANTPKQLRRAKELLRAEFDITPDNDYALKNQYDHPRFNRYRNRGLSQTNGEEIILQVNKRNVQSFPEERPHYC